MFIPLILLNKKGCVKKREQLQTDVPPENKILLGIRNIGLQSFLLTEIAREQAQ